MMSIKGLYFHIGHFDERVVFYFFIENNGEGLIEKANQYIGAKATDFAQGDENQ